MSILSAWRFDWITPAGILKAQANGDDFSSAAWYVRERAACPSGHTPPKPWCTCGIHAVCDLAECLQWADACLGLRENHPARSALTGCISRWQIEAPIPGAWIEGRFDRNRWPQVQADPPSTIRGRAGRLVGPMFVDTRNGSSVTNLRTTFSEYAVEVVQVARPMAASVPIAWSQWRQA